MKEKHKNKAYKKGYIAGIYDMQQAITAMYNMENDWKRSRVFGYLDFYKALERTSAENIMESYKAYKKECEKERQKDYRENNPNYSTIKSTLEELLLLDGGKEMIEEILEDMQIGDDKE